MLLAIVLLGGCASSGDILWPKPVSFTFTSDGETVTVDPCTIKLVVESPNRLVVQ